MQLSYDDERLAPVFGVLWTPQDNNLVFRVLLDMEYNRFLRFFFTYRQLSRDKDSAIVRAPLERTALRDFNLATVF
jgi:hypothetical protein